MGNPDEMESEIDIDEDGVESLKARPKGKKEEKRDGADESQLQSNDEEIRELANDAEGG